MDHPLTVVPFTDGAAEAARLIDAEAAPVASVLDPGGMMATEVFREAVLVAALDRNERATGELVAGVIYAARWGGGGVVIT